MCSPCSRPKNLENEYSLVKIAPVLISDEVFTPSCPPRVTQPTIGTFLIRTDGKNDYLNQKIEVHPKILEKWADKNRQEWVDKYGKNDYALHELCRKYSFKTVSFHPKNVPFKRLFPRPYSCEIDCLIENRLTGMKEIENKYRPAISKMGKMAKDAEKIESCKFDPPFWWNSGKSVTKTDPCEKEYPELVPEPKIEPLRWRPKLNICKDLSTCERREEMSQVGMPFRHEACKFYYKNYPAAKLTIFPQKFSK